MTFNRCYLAPVILLLILCNAWGQTELFGPDQEPTVESPTITALADDDPLLNQLLEQAGRGNQELGTSISSLARLNRWKEADALLTGISGKQLDEPTLAEIFFSIGAANYIRLKQSGSLSDSGNKNLDTLQTAAKNYSQSDQRLQKAINELVGGNEDSRLRATRILLSGGESSIIALVAAAAQPQPKNQRDRILSTLLALGGGGVKAVQQLALYGTDSTRLHSIESLARIDLERFQLDLATAAHASDSTPQERRMAEGLLSQLGSFPTRAECIEALRLDLDLLTAVANQQKNDGRIKTVWTINDQRNAVTSIQILSLHAAYRDVYDATSRLRRMGQLPQQLDELTAIEAVGYEVLVDPDWGDDEQIKSATSRYQCLVEAESVSAALAKSLELEQITAAIGLVRMIQATDWDDRQRGELLRGTAGLPSPLAQAALNADARLRYEAAVTVTKTADGEAFPGSSQVRRTLSEISRLSDQPTAILLETRPEVILQYEAILRNLGMNVQRASTVAQAQRLVALGGDLRLLLAKQQLADRTVLELIDTVRRTHRGRKLPIAVFGDEEIRFGSQRWQATTEFLFNPVTNITLSQFLARADQKNILPPLSGTDRKQLKEAANQLLSQP
ncbi:hypothetical protein OAL35_01300 [bacterium]|nr:hypothetical protein [bacterium]